MDFNERYGYEPIPKPDPTKHTPTITDAIKPLDVKLTVRVDVTAYKNALARTYNVSADDIELVFVQQEEQIYTETEKSKPAGGAIVGELSETDSKQRPFLQRLLEQRGFSQLEAAELCAISRSTIQRACDRQRLRQESYDAIVKRLELTPEEEREFSRSLRRKQRKKCRTVTKEVR